MVEDHTFALFKFWDPSLMQLQCEVGFTVYWSAMRVFMALCDRLSRPETRHFLGRVSVTLVTLDRAKPSTKAP